MGPAVPVVLLLLMLGSCPYSFAKKKTLQSGDSLVFLYSVRLGSIDVNHSRKGKEYYVSKIITYPSHYGITRDIALLKLLSTVTFTALILPICLPSISEQQLTLPASCWVTGWGQTQEGLYPSTLQEVEVPLVSNEGCKQLYNPVGISIPELGSIIEEDELCAGDIQTKKDSCKADSGGSLSCHIDGVWVLMGVVSWGLECGKSPLGVYVIVTYYQKWIKAIISRARGSSGDCTSSSGSPGIPLSLDPNMIPRQEGYGAEPAGELMGWDCGE